MTENIFCNIIHQIINDKTDVIFDFHVPTCVESPKRGFEKENNESNRLCSLLRHRLPWQLIVAFGLNICEGLFGGGGGLNYCEASIYQ